MHKTVYDSLAATIKKAPKQTAIVFEDQIITYGDLDGKIHQAARNLAALGVTKGTAFAVFAQNNPSLMIAYYAAAYLGAVFIPLNPNLTASEVEYALNHSRAKVMLHDGALADVATDAASPEILVDLATLLIPNDHLPAPVKADIEADADFLVIYTSGSTGLPKAIILDHAAQNGAAASLSQMWGVGAEETTLVALPLGYLYGLSTAAAVGLQQGGKVVILRRFHPRDVLQALMDHKVSLYHGVPTMFTMMLNYCEERDLSFDLSGMKALICAGAPLPLELRQRFQNRFGMMIQNYYAMTEATPVFGKFANDARDIPEGAAGRPAPGLEVRVIRADGLDCAIGEEGELLVRAAATMKCYMNAPEQTEASFAGDLFRTGDLGHLDADGFYHITGRLKDLIIRGGANLSPSEVENALASHPAVAEVAVVGGPDATFGEVPVAFVVLRKDQAADGDVLSAHALRLISDFKVPKTYFFEESLPLGLTGKVDKKILKARLVG